MALQRETGSYVDHAPLYCQHMRILKAHNNTVPQTPTI